MYPCPPSLGSLLSHSPTSLLLSSAVSPLLYTTQHSLHPHVQRLSTRLSRTVMESLPKQWGVLTCCSAPNLLLSEGVLGAIPVGDCQVQWGVVQKSH